MVERLNGLSGLGRSPAFSCHNDLLCENFIDDGHCLRIVDYELSGNNDACFDLGNTAQEAGFDDQLRTVSLRGVLRTRTRSSSPHEPVRP